MNLIFYFFIGILIIASCMSFYLYSQVKKYLQSFADFNVSQKEILYPKVTLLIPIYREENLIKKSIQYFSAFPSDISIIYITTSREKDNKTLSIAQEFLKEHTYQSIQVINSPNTFGNMATQLNYGLKYVPLENIVGIYNVDSEPRLETIKYVQKNIKENQIMQQVSIFSDSLNGVMKRAQLWQNRWSIIYEFGNLILKSKDRIGFMYTIGHGLFTYKNVLERNGGWDEDEINEDNVMGYKLSIEGIKFLPIPYFEKASFAHSKLVYIKQQSVWFNGPLYSIKYFFKYKKSVRNFLFSLLNLRAAITWLIGPIMFLVLFLWNLKQWQWLNIGVLLLTMSIYISGIDYLAVRLLSSQIKGKCLQPADIFFDYLFYLMHCVGPVLTIVKFVCGRNNIQNKYKTEK